MDLIFVGLAILITEEKSNEMGTYTEGEVVFLDPSAPYATPEENANAGRHNQVLVVRENEAGFNGALKPFPLQGAVKPEWLGLTSLEGLVGIPLRHSVAYALGVDGRELTFADRRSARPDFRTIDFVPSLNEFQPGLTLSKGWRQSPHVTTRFLLGSGEIGSATPMQGNVAMHTFAYGHQKDQDARHYSDVIRFTPQTTPTAIVVDHPDHRTVVTLNGAKQAWFMNLDDNRSDPTYDHFMLFGLLPWNFRAPRVTDSQFTGGDCLGARYHFKLQ